MRDLYCCKGLKFNAKYYTADVVEEKHKLFLRTDKEMKNKITIILILEGLNTLSVIMCFKEDQLLFDKYHEFTISS